MWSYRLQGCVAIARSAIKNLAANPVDVLTHMLLLANDNCSIYRLAHGARQYAAHCDIVTSAIIARIWNHDFTTARRHSSSHIFTHHNKIISLDHQCPLAKMMRQENLICSLSLTILYLASKSDCLIAGLRDNYNIGIKYEF
jgi:hypothetical protein